MSRASPIHRSCGGFPVSSSSYLQQCSEEGDMGAKGVKASPSGPIPQKGYRGTTAGGHRKVSGHRASQIAV